MNSRGQEGFGLLEVMVASTLLAIAVIGTGYLFVAGQTRLEERGQATGALRAARAKLEELSGLPFSHPDLETGIHPGSGWERVTVDDRGTLSTDDDLSAYRRWVITEVDDPADGTSAGEVDYKEVKVEIAQDSGFTVLWASLETLVSP